jgi:NADPH:quinone reductase-like Zn-dependent oxidoreductase
MDKMKAVICTKYGTPEVLKIVEIEKPTPKDNEVLIKIVASAVNSGDVRVRGLVVTGFLKIVMRFVLGFNRPRKPILGTVFSGVIEHTGKNVKGFGNGDEVFGLTGFKFGAHAEYITLSEKNIIAKKPVNATFEEAAAILFGGQTAVYFLEEKAKISEKENPKILIYGATGSVGTAAIQIAKFYNAQITAVCSEAGQNLVKELGVDDIVFYDKEDFTKRTEKFDIIFDAVGKTSKKQCATLLNDKGYYGTVGGLEVAAERIEQLEFLRKLFENGKYKATIDRVYSIDEIVDAYRYVDTSRKKGNVVLKIAE